MSDILKGISVIWMRLFDHRSFLNGEIQFVLREFEQKRDDQEVEKLFSIIEHITDIKDTQAPKAQSILASTVPKVAKNVETALTGCKSIEELEKKYKTNKSLNISHEDRKVEWKQFVDNITFDCSDIDQVCREKEEEIIKFYSNLDNKLEIPSV